MSEEHAISRRALLQGRFLRRSEASRAAVPPGHAPETLVMRYPKTTADAAPRRRNAIPVMRPPRAVDEPTFLGGCTRCAACIEACPHDAIIEAPQRLRSAAGTPMIDPDRQPCMMCDDFPCVDACEPDVLSSMLPVSMGTARITGQTCLAYNGTTCTVCAEHCPVDGAIEIAEGRPRVVEQQCTGCGVCRHVCPAPENAILLMPAFHRPGRPEAASP